MLRLALLATLVLLAAGCGGSKNASTTTTTTAAGSGGGTSTLSRSAAVNDAHPRVTARAYLTKCRDAFGKLRVGTVAKASVDSTKRQLTVVRTACGNGKSLKLLAQVNPGDTALSQAAAAETAIADVATNFGHYLDHVAAGTNGTKIFNYSVEEARQAKILLADAFTELK